MQLKAIECPQYRILKKIRIILILTIAIIYGCTIYHLVNLTRLQYIQESDVYIEKISEYAPNKTPDPMIYISELYSIYTNQVIMNIIDKYCQNGIHGYTYGYIFDNNFNLLYSNINSDIENNYEVRLKNEEFIKNFEYNYTNNKLPEIVNIYVTQNRYYVLYYDIYRYLLINVYMPYILIGVFIMLCCCLYQFLVKEINDNRNREIYLVNENDIYNIDQLEVLRTKIDKSYSEKRYYRFLILLIIPLMISVITYIVIHNDEKFKITDIDIITDALIDIEIDNKPIDEAKVLLSNLRDDSNGRYHIMLIDESEYNILSDLWKSDDEPHVDLTTDKKLIKKTMNVIISNKPYICLYSAPYEMGLLIQVFFYITMIDFISILMITIIIIKKRYMLPIILIE